MIHFVEKTGGPLRRGGTGALVSIQKELGGRMELNAEVDAFNREKPDTASRLPRGDPKERTHAAADIVVNADYAHTYKDLIVKEHRRGHSDKAIARKKYSMSLFVIYFGFKEGQQPLDLKHHNIILGPRYEELLTDIFDRKLLSEDFSQYLHVPTLTDPSMAPVGHHAAYTLIPVPNLKADVDWEIEGPKLMDRVLTFLEERGYIPQLKENLVHASLSTHGISRYAQLLLGQWVWSRATADSNCIFQTPTRSRAVENLYLVGANAQPGAGTPSVMMSAKNDSSSRMGRPPRNPHQMA